MSASSPCEVIEYGNQEHHREEQPLLREQGVVDAGYPAEVG
jgi:hypothetical protein